MQDNHRLPSRRERIVLNLPKQLVKLKYYPIPSKNKLLTSASVCGIMGLMPTVVNIKKQRCDVYIGRGSIYGNPYLIGRDGERDEVVRKYRKYFFERIARDTQFKEAVEWLRNKDVSLGCYCKPLECHGDVILEYLNRKD